MELDEAIKGRRSIRKFQDRAISDADIEELLDASRYAPSSMNGQPWHFIVIREEATKKLLTEIKNRYCPVEKQAYQADFLQNAAALIVVCVEKQKSYDRELENGVLATATILLKAYSKGLGSVYMSAYRAGEAKISDEIREALGIPEDVDPITIIPLGYPDELPEPKHLRPFKEIVSYEAFGER